MLASLLSLSILPLLTSALPNRPLDNPLHARQAPATAIWVSVDASGTPVTTVTPHETTIEGTPTLADAAPNEVTGSVFTLTEHVQITTSTGSRVPAPTGTDGKNPAGAFARCFKGEDEEFAPFCDPAQGSQLYVDRLYYVTWNPDFFNDTTKTSSNTTAKWRISIVANRISSTNDSDTIKAFETKDTLPAAWGVYPWKVTSSVLESKQPTNLTLSIVASREGQAETVEHKGPTILVTYAPAFKTQGPKLPKGAELYIALPSVAAFILVMLFGTCWWNKKSRNIGIGNIMSRSRHGYGVGKARAKRLAGNMRKGLRRKEERGIMLEQWDDINSREDLGPEGERYKDVPGRRDSDVLGSLAGTPVNDRFPSSPAPRGPGEGRNVFREEMERQDRQARDRPNY